MIRRRLFDENRGQAVKAALAQGDLGGLKKRDPALGADALPMQELHSMEISEEDILSLQKGPAGVFYFSLKPGESFLAIGYTFTYRGNRTEEGLLSDHCNFEVRKDGASQMISVPFFDDAYFDWARYEIVVRFSLSSKSDNPAYLTGRILMYDNR